MANVINQDNEALEWRAINWRAVNSIVNNPRQRIYRASVAGALKKVRSLQKLMLKARANRRLAIRRVTQINRGRNTPGIDNVTVDSDKGREILYRTLNNSVKENASPVRRIYIPKKDGRKRPLGIPVIADRCRQAIVKSALEPYWEAKFEPVSYGFRPGRSAHDAIQKIFCIARAQGTRHWVLDADIKGAFDSIDHNFLIKTIGGFPERNMIKQWLQAGVLEHGNYITSVAGTPQGGIISPLLANVALHGMETLLSIQYWKKNGTPKQGQPYAVVRYADDCNVYVRSHKAGQRVMNLLKRLYGKLHLQVNDSKSAVASVFRRSFLGYAFWITRKGEVKCAVSRKAKESFKQQIRNKTRRSGGRSITQVIESVSNGAKMIHPSG